MEAFTVMQRLRGTALGKSGGRLRIMAAVALALSAPTAASAQFSVQPVIVEMVTGDTTASTVLQVHNESDGPLQMRFYAADFDEAEDGSHTFAAPGTEAHSCSRHMRVFPDGATLEAHAVTQVRVLIEPVDSTCCSMVFIETGARAKKGISIAQRIGVKVYGEPKALPPSGEIRGVHVLAGEPPVAVIQFANLGAGPLRPQGDVEIRTLDGTVVGKAPVEAFSVLPGRLRSVRVKLDLGLAPGSYLAIPILDFGADYLAGGQASFEVAGP
jgi:hypothetical protein